MKRRKFLGGFAGLLAGLGLAKAASEPEEQPEPRPELEHGEAMALELDNGSVISASTSARLVGYTSSGFSMTWMKTPLPEPWRK